MGWLRNVADRLRTFAAKRLTRRRRTRRWKIAAEEAVFGSFPFRPGGYGVLHRSRGCRESWIRALREAASAFGEPPRDAEPAREGIFTRFLDDGTWMVVRAGAPGTDDRGRPGAMRFHARFLKPRDAARLRHDPFALAHTLRLDWTDRQADPNGTRSAEPVEIETEIPIPIPIAIENRIRTEIETDPRLRKPEHPDHDDRAGKIAWRLARGERVAIGEPPEIAAELAREAWARLPSRARRRRTLTTLAFHWNLPHDLVAGAPRAGWPDRAREAGYRPDSELGDSPALAPGEEAAREARRQHRGIAAMIALVLVAVLVSRIGCGESPVPNPDSPSPSADDPRPGRFAPARYASIPELDETDMRRLRAGLEEAALVLGAGAPENLRDEPTDADWMRHIAETLRHPGPPVDPPPDRPRAAEWERHLRHFRPGRELPPDFEAGPARRRLDILLWSFRLDDDPALARIPETEIPALLVQRLSRPFPLPEVRDDDPAPLKAQAAFLERLPRRP